MRKLVDVTVVVLVAVIVAAAAAAAASPDLKAMTLHESDLPAGFDQQFSHPLPRTQVIVIQGAVTHGYLGGWQREFTRVQGVNTAAATSSVLRYASADDAHRAVTRGWQHVLTKTGAKRLVVGRPLGSEARAFAYQSGVLSAYTLIWRYKNVTATVLVVGLKSLGVTLDLATRLAVKQQQRIREQT